MNALQQLRDMALNDSRLKHPTLPEGARYVKAYSDKTANSLTRCIIDFLRFHGHQAERIAVTGRYLDNSKVVTDVTGMTRRIGSGKWIPGSMQRGSADISAIVNGKSIKIEVKIGRDVMSGHQKEYREQVTRAGGLYWLVGTFEQFLSFYNEIG